MKKKYAYELVKVLKHYGEKDELKGFLDRANENGWTIVTIIPSDGWAVIIYDETQ